MWILTSGAGPMMYFPSGVKLSVQLRSSWGSTSARLGTRCNNWSSSCSEITSQTMTYRPSATAPHSRHRHPVQCVSVCLAVGLQQKIIQSLCHVDEIYLFKFRGSTLHSTPQDTTFCGRTCACTVQFMLRRWVNSVATRQGRYIFTWCSMLLH